ncbi:MAG: fibronectin type III domain-containing protein [Eubacterium sp.]
MKTFTKKSLSVVLAMLMALSTLTVGAMSAFADTAKTPYTDNASISTKGTTTFTYTAPKTGWYSVMLSVAPKDEKKSTPGGSFRVVKPNETNSEDEDYEYIGSASTGYYWDDDDEYYYSTYYSYKVENDLLVETRMYLPAQDMVKLVKGETYEITVNSFNDNTNANLLVTASDYLFYISTYTAELSYGKYTYEKWDDEKGEYVEVIKDYETRRVGNYTVGICANVYGYQGTSTTVSIPASISGYPVKEVSLEGTPTALAKRITSVTIPEGVEEIDGMFGFYALTSVNFPSSLEYIGASAFSRCHSLTGQITIPASVKSVGSYAFYDTGITSVEFLSNETSVGAQAFGYNIILDETTDDPTDTTTGKVDGFFVIAPANSLPAKYAVNNGFDAYDRVNCAAGNHPYAVTTVDATLFAAGSTTSVCPVCGNTVKTTISKKTFKISSVKSSKKNTLVVKAPVQAGITGYVVEVSTSKKFTTKTTKKVTVKTTKALNKTITGLKGGTKYYVRVRATGVNANGKTVYSKYTPVKSIKIKK